MKDHQDEALKKYEEDVEPTRDEATFVPATDIYEKDDAILVRCDMPGVGQDDVDITLENNELVIIGRQAAAAVDGRDALMREYESGTFQRVFKVPQLIDRDKIKARLRNGVLDLELPKAELAKPRKIAITTGG